MKITIGTMGTRGDVQPYAALGLRLQANGHEVQIGTDPLFEDFITELGLSFIPIEGDVMHAVSEANLDLSKNPLKVYRWIQEQFERVALESTRKAIEVCRGTDFFLSSSLALGIPHIAEALNTPYLPCYLQPVTPSRDIPPMLGLFLPDNAPLRGPIYWHSTHFNNRMFFGIVYKILNQVRSDVLGIEPLPWRVYASMDVSDFPIIYGFSPHVIAPPSDWQAHHHITGYWLMDEEEDWEPPAELAEFLAAGPPPIFLGFGSMLEEDNAAATDIMIEAIALSSQRAIIQSGWSGLGQRDLPEHILKVDNLPHSWLFPRMAAVVHHGGMGTTATAMRAGVPAVVVPFISDQPFWGYYVEKLGIGPAAIPRRKLIAKKLAAAIQRAASDAGMRRKAAALSEKLRAEDGVGQAVQVIEKYLENPEKLLVTRARMLQTG